MNFLQTLDGRLQCIIDWGDRMPKLQRIDIISGIFIMFFIILLNIHSAVAQSPLLSEGGVDTHLYKCDTVIFEATALEDGTGTLPGRVFSAGLSMLHSPYLSIFYIPLKYGLNDNFNISFSLPFLTKTLVYNNTHYVKSGYGDTMLGFTGYFQPFDSISSTSALRITFPTGNTNAQDFDYYIPLGYGGYTSSFQETVSIGSFDTGPVSLRLFISGIGIYYFKSNQKIDSVEKNTYDPSYSWGVLAGLDFGITENLDFQIKGNYINVKERKYVNNTVPGVKNNANDSVKQINILPFIKYRFLDDITGEAGIIYPVKTTQDSSLATTYDPKWKLIFAIEKRFGDGTTSHSANNDKTVSYEGVKSWNPSKSEEKTNKSEYSSKKKRKRRR